MHVPCCLQYDCQSFLHHSSLLPLSHRIIINLLLSCMVVASSAETERLESECVFAMCKFCYQVVRTLLFMVWLSILPPAPFLSLLPLSHCIDLLLSCMVVVQRQRGSKVSVCLQCASTVRHNLIVTVTMTIKNCLIWSPLVTILHIYTLPSLSLFL